MLKLIGDATLPTALQGPLLVDGNGLPRFWSIVWSVYASANLADSSKLKQLGYLEYFYRFVDELKGSGALDDAIGAVDLELLGEMLEAFFVSLQNSSINTNTLPRWQTAFTFVLDTTLRLRRSSVPAQGLRQIEARIRRLESLYSSLRIGRRRTQETIRSLPSSVVEALYEMLDPTSGSNPFRSESTKWRVFILFVILLHQGLRRGELLLLPADAVKHGFDKQLGKERYWLNISDNPYESIDERFSKPSIKTVDSVRQIPVSEVTAGLIQEYTENYRGKAEHSYLINSQHGKALSMEAVTKLFAKISASLPSSAVETLYARTGKKSVTPHDLRHTCAVVRLNQLLQQGDPMDEALQKMRTFFGWSRTSDMPRKYARAVFEDRLASVWNNIFDDRVTYLRSIPGAIHGSKSK